MRVISMVPSWTETLVQSGVQVVGRTRFCIHPVEQIKSIPAVGGTKDWNLEQIQNLNADLIVLDQEENPKWMADLAPVPWIATHIQKIEDVPANLRKINLQLNSSPLEILSLRWESAIAKPHRALTDPQNLPGVLKWIKKPQAPITQVLYLIWRKPYMAVSRDTFIGSVFEHISGGRQLPCFPKKYPEIDLSQFETASTLLLLSTEPFPFLKFENELRALHFPCAIVDGEAFSWFGTRSLQFLEEHS